MKQIQCNKCGIYMIVNENNIFLSNQFHTIRLKFNYGSSLDTTSTSFTLCDSCMQQFLSSLAIPANTSDYL